jgi:hypothetical protein
MAYDATFGGNAGRGWCLACRRPLDGDRLVARIDFQSDPDGRQGLSGLYHKACARPFASMARIINMNPWAGF